jgi:hypothetical protein
MFSSEAAEPVRDELSSGQTTELMIPCCREKEALERRNIRLAELNERYMEDELPELLTLSLRLRKASCRALSSDAPNMLE